MQAKGSKTATEEEAGDNESPKAIGGTEHEFMFAHRQQIVFGRNPLVVVDTARDQL